jgi:hypothetical protein
MKSTLISSISAAALAAFSFPLPHAEADAVTEWNAIMQATVTGNPLAQARSAAIVQLSVFEAVNAITGAYEPYLGTIIAPAGASPDAAAVAAAYRALVTLQPGSVAALDAARATSLAAIPDGVGKDAGIAVGEAAAAAMLLLRANDGAAVAGAVPYTPGTAPGDWQPTPPALAPAFLPGWGQVTPFGLEAGWQFRLPPPPMLESGIYARDYNEVKLVGNSSAGPELRSPGHADRVRWFAATSPVPIWNSAARQVSAAQGRTLSENARIFALLGMAISDSSIAVWDSKYFYNFWRPVTAIREGATDGNPKTDPDGAWSTYTPTPPYPSYPSGYAGLSGAARIVLERVLGTQEMAITLTNPTNPTVANIVLNYTEWKQICDEIDDARVYGGIHFRFEQEAGRRLGKDVGHYILDNYLRSPEGDGEIGEEE